MKGARLLKLARIALACMRLYCRMEGGGVGGGWIRKTMTCARQSDGGT